MWSEILWGKKARLSYLFIAAVILLFAFLGSREIWTQEHRWADIVSGMFFRNDFLHPYLGEVDYYDKPLLSYWLIALIAKITGHLSTWALRLPSALAGLLAVWSTYRLGVSLKNKQLGLMAGWMLLTTFYFVFWSRTSSADMLNVAGSVFAVSWYFEKKNQPSFFNYAIFFLIIAVTSLCKGLVGAVVPLLVVFPDFVMRGEWKKHLRFSFFLAMIPALLVYVAPFWLSVQVGGEHYGESGLYLVYRENILRYFQPFDHKGPIYTYFIFLPIYLMPWTFFFLPALVALKNRWRSMSAESKWMLWAMVLLFLFFTLSGSRRNYYVLPLVPFAILFTADWILAGAEALKKRYRWAGVTAMISFVLLVMNFNILQPLHYVDGLPDFANRVMLKAGEVRSWSEWKVVLLDPESKVRFYLQLPPNTKEYAVVGLRDAQTEESLRRVWRQPLSDQQKNIIFVTRKIYAPRVRNLLPGYEMIESKATWGERVFHIKNENAPVAFLPLQ